MHQPKQLLSIGAVLLVLTVVGIGSRARGKDDPHDKRPDVEDRTLFDEISQKSHPMGRILAARIKEPDGRSKLWSVETVAGVGLTMSTPTGRPTYEHRFELFVSVRDSAGNLLQQGTSKVEPKGGPSFATVIGAKTSLSQKPAPGQLTISAKLTANAKDGTVIDLDASDTTVDIR